MTSIGCLPFLQRSTLNSRPNPQQIIRINARGRQLATFFQTISKTNSPVLQDLVAEAATHSSVDLDVDPQVFEHVLNFLRDGAGFILPHSSDELFALLELAENLRMPELAEVIFERPAECCEPTISDEWPTNSTGTCVHFFAGEATTHSSLQKLMSSCEDEPKGETSSTFPDDDLESEDSDCSERSIGDCSPSNSVSKASLFISPDEVLQYSHRNEGVLSQLDDLQEQPVKRQWLLGNGRY